MNHTRLLGDNYSQSDWPKNRAESDFNCVGTLARYAYGWQAARRSAIRPA